MPVKTSTLFAESTFIPKQVSPKMQELQGQIEALRVKGCVSFKPNSTNIVQAVPERNPLDKLMFPDGNAATSPCDLLKNFGTQFHKIDNKVRLRPNVNYVREGYNYATDSSGRITSAGGKLKAEPYKGGLTTTLDYAEGYDRGHLIGRQFGGSPDLDNLVRMKESVNRANGEFDKLENEVWKKAVARGERVEVNIKLWFYQWRYTEQFLMQNIVNSDSTWITLVFKKLPHHLEVAPLQSEGEFFRLNLSPSWIRIYYMNYLREIVEFLEVSQLISIIIKHERTIAN